MKFRTKVVVNVALACITCTAAAVFISVNEISTQGDKQIIGKSQAILSRLESVRSYVASQGGLHDTIDKVVAQYPDGNLPHEEKLKVLKQVPIFAAMQVGAENAADEGYKFRVFSNFPRNPDNKSTVSEAEILKRFLDNPDLKEILDDSPGELRVYRPVRLLASQGCMACHGEPAKSPWKNGKDILGYPMEDWKDGRLHGSFAIISSKASVQAAAKETTLKIILIASVLSIIAIGASYYALRKPIIALSTIADELQEAGVNVSSSSSNISQSSSDLSRSANTAASSIEQTTATTEEISSMIRLNAEHTVNARNLAEQAQNKARHGKEEVEKLVHSMDAISASSIKIVEIITVIDDIAFQTNLLALNASVEAARAGEQGKGFAVVADAVRALAQRSATSAKEISKLIGDSVEKIQSGHSTVKTSGAMLNDIVNEIEKLTTLNIEISNASKEQAQGVTAINASITELDKVTQDNAAAANSCATAAEELNEQSQHLHHMVQSLVSVIEGKDAA